MAYWRTFAFVLEMAISGTCLAFQQEQWDMEDSTSHRHLGVVPLPILYYTPETGIAGGAAVHLSYRSDTAAHHARPSSALVDVVYTEHKQIIAEIIPDFYLLHSDLNVTGFVRYLNYPDKFYGIGSSTPEDNEEPYTSKAVGFSLDSYRRTWQSFSAGVSFYYEQRTRTDVKSGG